MANETYVKQKIKDSVFTHFFRDPKNVFQLFRELHPEITDVSESDVDIITLTNVLVNEMYNDLGFIAGDRLIVLVEAQSTWTVNIIPRVLLYLTDTLKNHLRKIGVNLYGTTKAKIPQVEAYVIYVGPPKPGVENGVISLKDEFYGGVACSIDLSVNVICSSQPESLIGQYIAFCRVTNEQIKLYGHTREAIKRIIQICKEKDILKEYLKTKETEVLDIMTDLFDQEEIFRVYVEEEKAKVAKAAEEKAERAAKAAAERAAKATQQESILALKGRLPAEEIASAFKLPLQKVLDILTGDISSAITSETPGL